MSFTFKVTFTGLGLALIHSKKNEPGVVTGVDLLLIDTSKAAHVHGQVSGAIHDNGNGNGNEPSFHHHLPRMTLQLDDVSETGEESFPGPHVTAGSLPLIELPLEQKDLLLKVTGADGHFTVNRASMANAVHPGQGAPIEAIDWIPEPQASLGIDPFIPGADLKDSPYISRVKLPAGDVSSRNLFLMADGKFAEFTFGNSVDSAVRRVLAEQFVWTRSGVEKVEIPFGKGLTLDALLRELEEEPTVVEVSVTNLPELVDPQRFRAPDHFPLFGLISKANKVPNLVSPVASVPQLVTRGGACPPLQTDGGGS